ncbi:MAG: hypothetical protein EOP75_00010 [Variovorax sp.]|nr:MAG: hypothetical protein EOP75_00010 [Variovorax sp.]
MDDGTTTSCLAYPIDRTTLLNPDGQGANRQTDAASAAMEVEMFDDNESGADALEVDASTWYSLTDQYAAAIFAMERGEPHARERVLAVYEKLRNVPPLNDSHRQRA